MKKFDVTIRFNLGDLTATRTHSIEARSEEDAITIVDTIETVDIINYDVCLRND